MGTIRLRVPGRHNLLNALAAVAVGFELDLAFDQIAQGLEAFTGVERRFERKGEVNGVLVIDDYGHHPAEIAAVIAAARGLGRRIVVGFQPHRFTRTAALLDDFGPAFRGADRVIVTDIYAAGEEPIAGIALDTLVAAMRRTGEVRVDAAPSLDDLVVALRRSVQPGDVVITLGAGSIGGVGPRLLHALEDAMPVRNGERS
jgi:UDP-N-acetylmuramate--alanine ligase